MSTPFLGEIRIVGFTFAPSGWAFCDGQLLPINQNQALYSLLGTTYGGDGVTTFALPDLRGRVPLHAGAGIVLGAPGGAEVATLDPGALAAHSHALRATAGLAVTAVSAGNVLAGTGVDLYGLPGSLVEMAPDAVTESGGQPHDNIQPLLALNFVIALAGLFPSPN